MAIDEKLLATLKESLFKEKTTLEESLGRIAKPIDQLHGDYKPTFENIGSDREDNTTEPEQYTDNLPVEITLEKKLQDTCFFILDYLDFYYFINPMFLNFKYQISNIKSN